MIDADGIPRDPVAIRKGIARARVMLADPVNRSLRRRLHFLIDNLEALATALAAEKSDPDSGTAAE